MIDRLDDAGDFINESDRTNDMIEDEHLLTCSHRDRILFSRSFISA